MNGMKFTANEVVKIIEAGGKNGVAEFEVGDLKIKFDSAESLHKRDDYMLPVLDGEEIPFIEKDDEEIQTEAEYEQLVVTDPVAAEEMELKQLHGDNSVERS